MRTITRITRGTAAIAVLLLTGTACTGGGDGGARVASLGGATATTRSAGGTGDKQSFEDAMLDFARCMRDHGVDMPDPQFDGNGGVGLVRRAPGGGGDGPDDETFQKAQEACEPIMRAAEQNMPRPSPEEEAKMRDQALKFARCMRDHGVDMPDPTFDDGGRVRIEVKRGTKPSGSGSASGDGPAVSPRLDPEFDAALKACEKDAPFKAGRRVNS